MLLTAPDGRIVEVDDADSIRRLRGKGYADSTPDQIEEYRARQASVLAAAGQSTGGVYYQTVGPSRDGYGMSRDILKYELFQAGVNLEERYDGQKVGLLYSYPYGVRSMQTDVRLIMTMFESDKLPADWPEYLSEADEVIVPSKFCADTFAKSGIAATVVPLGYNDRVFSFQRRPVPVERDMPFTFIHYDSFNDRKGFWEVFNAFNEEFSHKENVKLILKTTAERPPVPIVKSQYPNIEVVAGELTERELVALLGRANCMVYPSKGEGFGITPLEAMATGIPAIVPNAHGISEYFNADYMLEVAVAERVPAIYARFREQDVGKMVECDVADLQAKMRYAFNNQRDMKELGESASEYVKAFTYKHTAAKLAEILARWQNTEVAKRADGKVLNVERL